MADEVSKKIEFYISYGDLLLSKTKFNQPLVKKVVANLTSNRYGSSILSIERALNEFQDICDAFDLDPKELIIRLNGWSQYLNDLEFSRIKECIPDVNFFKYAVETDNDLTKFALNHLEKQFNEMTIEEWQDSLRDEYSYEFQLLLTIDAYKVKQNLIDAFIFVMKEIANGEHTVTYQDQLEELLSLIESKKPKIMSKLFLDLRDIFCKDAIISVQNFLLFIDWLFKYGKLEKNPESFRRIFNEDVLGSDECINKILNNHKEMSKILSSSADRGYFDDKITDLCTRNPDNEQLIAFAKTNSILINTHSENTNSE
ncbi:MAG: hypothetical protein LBG64_00590 [Pseudomonadales bacterium]|nr:hypothetical protein [Pseudomonadales bacterium]